MKSKKDTREKILESARIEFAKRGMAGARVDRIAIIARVNKAMIYYHFHSKENLYQAVIDEQLGRIGEFLEKNIVADMPLEDIFYGISEFINRLLGERKNFMPIMLREIADGGERIRSALTRTIFDKGFTIRVRKLIEKEIAAGKFRKVDSKQAMISFLGMNIFYLIMAPAINAIWEIKDEDKFRRERPREVVDIFLNGLKIEKT